MIKTLTSSFHCNRRRQKKSVLLQHTVNRRADKETNCNSLTAAVTAGRGCGCILNTDSHFKDVCTCSTLFRGAYMGEKTVGTVVQLPNCFCLGGSSLSRGNGSADPDRPTTTIELNKLNFLLTN